MRSILVLSLTLAACGPGLGGTEDGEGSGDAGSSASESSASASGSASSASASASAGSSGMGSADESGPDVDDCDGVCVALADPGDPWRGPLAIATTEDLSWSGCPSGSPNGLAKFGHQLVDTREPCECTCSTPSPSACSAPVELHGAPGCDGEPPQPASVGSGCLPLEDGAAVRIEPPTHDGACEPYASPPSVSYDLFTALCEVEVTSRCPGGGECVPTTGLDGVVCWWAPGELACPPGLADRRIVYSATDDQRTCAEGCACAGAPTCAGGVIVHESCREEPPEQDPLLPGECRELAGLSAISPAFEIEGECTPVIPSVAVIGEIFESAPQTLCCTAG